MRNELIKKLRDRIAFLGELGVEAFDAGRLMELSLHANTTDSRVAAIRNSPSGPIEAEPKRSDFVPPPKLPERSRSGTAKTERQSMLGILPSLKDLSIPEQVPTTNVGGNTSTDLQVEQRTQTKKTISMETIQQIRDDIGPNCTRCKLANLGRKQVVNSVGNFNADLMFVGEAPGADEDAKGEPFVGRAGQLLTDIIEKGLEMPRESVFIGNINRCRPPKNRAPEPDESAVCKPFLLREIAVVRPKVIVVLGATAAQNLLETKTPIGKLRGQFHDYMGVKVMPTFHPAYLLRDPNKKRDVWEDIKLVKNYLRGSNT